MATENTSTERSAPPSDTASQAQWSDRPALGSSAATSPAPESSTSNSRGRSDSRGSFRSRGERGRNRGRGFGEHGGRGRRGREGGPRHPDWNHDKPGTKRERKEKIWEERKRQRVDDNGNAEPSFMTIPFSKEEIAAEERKPKRKVAVMIGYAGTGYHGLQINHDDKTIEGDIFAALVEAKAIAKSNADDPRKSGLVRCARTDKGVHAAGNVLSLKLIIEDPDIVKKINDALPPQIRVWGVQRTNNNFSCYQACDSRWYEYLMPSYCLLPPHPDSFLAKQVKQSVIDKGLEAQHKERMGDLHSFWEEVEANDIQLIYDSLPSEIRDEVVRKFKASNEDSSAAAPATSKSKAADDENKEADTTEQPEPSAATDEKASEGTAPEAASEAAPQAVPEDVPGDAPEAAPEAAAADNGAQPEAEVEPAVPAAPREISPVDAALKRIKAAYVAAKRRYRVTPDRIAQLQEALDLYTGTHNFHNYTIQKSAADPSAKRLVKSFVANPVPIQINDTQWLSLKVHGQSFMMHQIRKMVGMAVLLARCGTPVGRVQESYGPYRISIPKAPSLGLLLERPVFDNYNTMARSNFDKPAIDFGNYEREMQEFKDEHIYKRIFELEEKENSFHLFFHQVDNFKSESFLWVTAGGVEAARQRMGLAEDGMSAGKQEGEEREQAVPDALKDDGDEVDVEGGEG